MNPKTHLYLSCSLLTFVSGVYLSQYFSNSNNHKNFLKPPSKHSKNTLNSENSATPKTPDTMTKITEATRLKNYKNKFLKNEKKINFLERFIGVTKLRKKLISAAHGDVLEIATGTGRNLLFYDKSKISSITFVDKQKRLLSQARLKWSKLQPCFNERGYCDNEGDSNNVNEDFINLDNNESDNNESDNNDKFSIKKDGSDSLNNKLIKRGDNIIKTKFIVSDAKDLKELDNNSFDTVVDTFGICSFEEPEKSIKEMVRVCKPGGTLLFLEHGKGTSKTVNKLMEKNLEKHVEEWGCFYNRDIVEMVAKNKNLGIKIVSVKRKHFGTVIMICGVKNEKD